MAKYVYRKEILPVSAVTHKAATEVTMKCYSFLFTPVPYTCLAAQTAFSHGGTNYLVNILSPKGRCEVPQLHFGQSTKGIL